MTETIQEKTKNPARWLPHGPPMVLLSGCVPAPAGEAVDAWVDVTPDSPFFDHVAGGVPGCIALEYMVQAAALFVGRVRGAEGLPPGIGFVLGTRRMEIAVPVFLPGRRYNIHAVCSYHDESFGSFECSVTDAAGAVLAVAQMTAFQPEEGAGPERLEEFA
jgi:predicted hotdog family 3-hydroxylacyl-ACP dehydratase